MWQRIQSVFIILVIVSLVLAIIYPVWIGLDKDVEYKLYPIYLLAKEEGLQGKGISSAYFPNSLSAILMVAIITIAVTEFRRFDNRLLQVKLGLLNSLLLLALVIAEVFFASQLNTAHPGKFEIGLYFVMAAIVCNWLAVRFIRHDEKKVRDADRIR